MKPIKLIKGTYQTGDGLIMSDGKNAILHNFKKHTGEVTKEKEAYIVKRYEIYCKKNNLKML